MAYHQTHHTLHIGTSYYPLKRVPTIDKNNSFSLCYACALRVKHNVFPAISCPQSEKKRNTVSWLPKYTHTHYLAPRKLPASLSVTGGPEGLDPARTSMMRLIQSKGRPSQERNDGILTFSFIFAATLNGILSRNSSCSPGFLQGAFRCPAWKSGFLTRCSHRSLYFFRSVPGRVRMGIYCTSCCVGDAFSGSLARYCIGKIADADFWKKASKLSISIFFYI